MGATNDPIARVLGELVRAFVSNDHSPASVEAVREAYADVAGSEVDVVNDPVTDTVDGGFGHFGDAA